ncbi:MAG: HAD family phosphatase [Candidatus Micrarchaeota archaeon]|nr:HAD family phosphatase [Candidatus Micrarchaeota archaeon]
MDAPRPLTEITDEQILRTKLVVFDVDGVIIPKGTNLKENGDGTVFHMETHKLSEKFVKNITELKRHVKISFSSGRNLLYLRSLTKDVYDKSVILQSENAAIIFINGEISTPQFPDGYFEAANRLRNLVLANANELGLRGFEPKIYNLAVHMDENYRINDLVKEADPEGHLYCIWTGEAFDVGLKGVTKGAGLEKIAETLNLERNEIITTGNALNDKEMLESGVGVTMEPDRVWAPYRSSGAGLGGEELVEFLVSRFRELKK